MVWIRLSPASSFVRLGTAPYWPPFTCFPGDEHQVGGAVVRAEVDVFGNAPSEFREDHHHHVVRAADPLQIRQERRNRIGRVGQQPLVHVVLEHVRVKRVVAIGRVVKARGHAGVDQRGDFGQVEAGDSVVHRRMIFGPGFPHQHRSVLRAAGRIQKESPRRIVDLRVIGNRFQNRLLVVELLLRKLVRIVEHHGNMPAAAHRQRLPRARY